MAEVPTYSYLHVTSATGLPIATQNGLPRPCVLGGISVNKTAVGTITIKDGGTTVAAIAATSAVGTYLNGRMALGNGNVTMTASTEDITILFE